MEEEEIEAISPREFAKWALLGDSHVSVTIYHPLDEMVMRIEKAIIVYEKSKREKNNA